MQILSLTVNGGGCSSLFCSSSYSFSSNSLSKTPLQWGFQRSKDVNFTNLGIRRMNGRAFQILGNPNVPSAKGNPNGEIVMVDPLEAKRLAAEQMQEIKAREKFERQRQIEAINGAWAMIGLTAGLVVEGHTGNNIVSQLTGYWSTILSFLDTNSPLKLDIEAPLSYLQKNIPSNLDIGAPLSFLQKSFPLNS